MLGGGGRIGEVAGSVDTSHRNAHDLPLIDRQTMHFLTLTYHIDHLGRRYEAPPQFKMWHDGGASDAIRQHERRTLVNFSCGECGDVYAVRPLYTLNDLAAAGYVEAHLNTIHFGKHRSEPKEISVKTRIALAYYRKQIRERLTGETQAHQATLTLEP